MEKITVAPIRDVPVVIERPPIQKLEWPIPPEGDRWAEVKKSLWQWIAWQCLKLLPKLGSIIFSYIQTGRFPVMKDMKTTICAAVAAIMIAVAPIIKTGELDWGAMALAATVQLLGLFAKDKDKKEVGSNGGTI